MPRKWIVILLMAVLVNDSLLPGQAQDKTPEEIALERIQELLPYQVTIDLFIRQVVCLQFLYHLFVGNAEPQFQGALSYEFVALYGLQGAVGNI